MALRQQEQAIINLVINGDAAKTSLKEVSGAYNALRAEIRGMKEEDDPKLYEEKIKQLQRLKEVQNAMNKEINGGASAWARFKEQMMATAAGVVGADAVESLMEKVLGFIPKMIEGSAKLSDELADIQKTTGLTEREAELLNARFKTIDTRTTREDLRAIAANAGQLGVIKEDLFSFTESIDKANVALGDEFQGGAGQVSDTLGKLRNIFSDIRSDKIDQDILHIANALNGLGADGLATAPVVSDFASRIGSVAIPLGLSTGQVLGLSASLQELNVNTERGSTAVVSILQRMLTNTTEFAKVAGMSVKDFKNLLNTDLFAAFNKVVEGAGKSKDKATEFATLLDKLKIDGAGASQVIASLASNQELLGTRVNSATELLKNQDSILNEFDLKNNNRAANLEKLSKRFGALFATSAADRLSDTLIAAANKGVTVLETLISVLAGLMNLLIAAGAGFIAYSATVMVATVTQRQWLITLIESELATKVVMAAEATWSAIKLVLTGRIREARAAMAGFNAVIGVSPIGLLIGALTAVVVGVMLYKDRVDAAADAQKKLNEIHDSARDKIRDEQERIEQLQSVIKDEISLREDKLVAIKKLREILPGHLKGYSDEEIMAGKASNAIAQYVKTLEHKAAVEGAYEELKKLKNQQRKVEGKDGELNWVEWTGVFLTDIFGGSEAGQKTLESRMKQNKGAALASIKAQIDAINAEFAADFKQKALDTPEPPKTGGAADKPEDESDKIKNRRAALLEQSKNLTQQFKNFTQDELNDLLAKNEKEIKDTELKFDKMIQKEMEFVKDKDARKLLSAKQIQKHQDEADALELQKKQAVHDIAIKQEERMMIEIERIRSEMSGKLESETQREYNRINAFYDKLIVEAGNNETQKAIIENNRQKDITDATLRAKERLHREIEAIEDQAPVASANRDKVELARINKKYDDQVKALKDKYARELGATKDFQAAMEAIERNRRAEIEQHDKDEERRKKEYAIEIAESVSNAVFQISAQNRAAQLDADIASIEKRRDKELENKNLTERQKKAINDKADAEIKKAKLEAWEADQDAALKQAVIATALAVTKALPNVFAAAAAGVAGLAQIAVIRNQKPPKFYTGVRRASEGFAIVGEAGPELVEQNGRVRLVDKEELTYLQEGANVYNPAETAEIMRGNSTKSVAKVAFDTMTTSAAAVRFDSQNLSKGIEALRFGNSNSSALAQVEQIPSNAPPIDLSPMMEVMREMIDAQKAANDKQVYLIYQDFEKFANKIVQARMDAGQ